MSVQLSYQKIIALHTQDIAWLQGDGSYTYIYFKNGEWHLISKAISFLERQLCPHVFMRINRNTVVNLDCVKILETNQPRTLWLNSGECVGVSRRRFKQLSIKCESLNLISPKKT